MFAFRFNSVPRFFFRRVSTLFSFTFPGIFLYIWYLEVTTTQIPKFYWFCLLGLVKTPEAVLGPAKDPFSLHAFATMFPEIALSVMLLILVAVFPFRFVTRDSVCISLLFIGVASIVWFFWISHYGAPSSFFGVYALSTFSKDIRFILFLFFVFLLLLDYSLLKVGKVGLILFGFAFLGMMFLLCSEDFFFLFLTAELVSLASCFLIALPRTRLAVEAAIKYFATGVFSASLLLFGILIFFFIHESVTASPFVPTPYPLEVFTIYSGEV
jgi:hypothetical protein